MIKFFRKIRQKLLSENRFSKYLIYAFGEIILVVIGILIALSINNWNENTKSRNSEKLLLNNLKEEFIFNLSELKKTKKRIDNTTNQLKVLLNLFGTESDKISIEEIDKLIYDGLWGPTFDSNKDVFNSIYDNGKMDLITNPTLKELLLSWGSEIKDFEHAESTMSTNLNRNVMPKMEKLIALRNPENIGNIKNVKGSKIKTDNRTVLSNLEAENIFFNHLWELENVGGLYSSLTNSIENIIDELEK